MRALEVATGRPWAMQTAALNQLLQVAARQNNEKPEALEAYRGNPASHDMQMRGETAVINIRGPLFRYANLFTEISGATSYEIIRQDLQAALDDDAVQSIVLNVNSPGGDADGCNELAKAIRAAEKPVIAYVGGRAESAAYFIASAADEIVVDDMALLGSIGVVIAIVDTEERDEANGIKTFEFVSSKSPKKRSDPKTEDGAGETQRIADEMGDVFIAAVAAHRGVSIETVEKNFGQGGVLVGASAVSAGMADRIGTFEGVIAELAETPKASAKAITGQKENSMTDQTTADIQAAAQNAVEADRARRASIMALDEAAGREALAEHLYANTEMSVENIDAVLAAAPKPAAKADPAEDYEQGRLAASGLGGTPKAETLRFDIVANTRARAGKA